MPRKESSGAFARIGGSAAVGFAGAIVLPNLIAVPAGLPLTGADLTEVTGFFGTHRVAAGLSLAFTPAAWLLATVFGAGAVAVLRPGERRRGEAWSLIGLAGLLMQNATFAGVAATRLALGTVAGRGDQAAAPLWALHDGLFTLNGTFLAVALVGLSVAGARGGLIARWHAALGYTAAGLLFLSASLAFAVVEGRFGFLGLTGWLLWVVWLVGYGVTLLRSASPAGGSEHSRSSLP